MDAHIAKVDDEKRQIFGWASVSLRTDGEQIIDSHGDQIDPEDLEAAAYEFVLNYREANDMHQGPVVGRLIESAVFTPEKLEVMGLAKDALPVAWWFGLQLEDEDAWAAVKNGKRRMLSIEGKAQRVSA